MATIDTGLLTVAAISKGRKTPAEYAFNEHQRIFTLADGAAGAAMAKRLDDARKRSRPVHVGRDVTRGTVTLVEAATDDEIARYSKDRPRLSRASKVRRIDLARIDPTTFNWAGHDLKWPLFRRCTTIIPNYAKAKQVFDACAAKGCQPPAAPTTPACIPFQYVVDGCYARAHKMRRLLVEDFGYCCEKVFSFALLPDRLGVRASKWGGCCVTWWYHVAPLVRVRVKLRGLPKPVNLALAMVIDPSMFDTPVLLSTWLTAQENVTCTANARVTQYSIQPGSAYTPMGTNAFSTDPHYTATEGTLLGYHNLTTC